MSTDAHANLHRPAGYGGGQSARKANSAPEQPLRPEYDPEVIRSRRALIDVIGALSEHTDALTVLGAHAVIEMTQGIPGTPPDDSTRDGDLGVTPYLLLPTPFLAQVMTDLGYERAYVQRPGVWSPVEQRHLDFHARDTIDLIAPMEVSYSEGSRRPRRAARVGEHGDDAVSATVGTELSVIDREWRYLRSFDDGEGVEVFVAGRAALLCAKAYKVHDRIDTKEFQRNADRLRPKDFADMYRLLLASEPEQVADLFAEGVATERIGPAVELGRDYLIELMTDADSFAAQVADAWQDPSREQDFADAITTWVTNFARAITPSAA
jgi:hypothetical protein